MKIILDPHEEQVLHEGVDYIELAYPPACMLVKLERFGMLAIGDLKPSVVPIFLVEQLMQITMLRAGTGETKTKTVKQHHLPLTESYALTDY